jgi:alkylation response protein AidB-like acyl-CoA dehydrogenase
VATPASAGRQGVRDTTAREVVDIAVQVVGAASVSKRHELERLLRDVRTGSLHPPNTDAVLEAIGATALGQT